MQQVRKYSRKYSGEYNPLAKVHYRPVEAAIRWSGLARHEREILQALNEKRIPEPGDFPKWPALRLNTERLYDAIANDELPFGIDGAAVHDKAYSNDPHLTIRHVDLKLWMTRYYPDHKPDFLFSSIERLAHPTISVDAVRILTFECDTFREECDALRKQIERRDHEIEVLRSQLKKHDPAGRAEAFQDPLGVRSETTYLHIVGGLLDLLLGHAPSGHPYSSFKTQEAIISAMTAHHGERVGISKSTLESKFAAARRTLAHH